MNTMNFLVEGYIGHIGVMQSTIERVEEKREMSSIQFVENEVYARLVGDQVPMGSKSGWVKERLC